MITFGHSDLLHREESQAVDQDAAHDETVEVDIDDPALDIAGLPPELKMDAYDDDDEDEQDVVEDEELDEFAVSQK